MDEQEYKSLYDFVSKPKQFDSGMMHPLDRERWQRLCTELHRRGVSKEEFFADVDATMYKTSTLERLRAEYNQQ